MFKFRYRKCPLKLTILWIIPIIPLIKKLISYIYVRNFFLVFNLFLFGCYEFKGLNNMLSDVFCESIHTAIIGRYIKLSNYIIISFCLCMDSYIPSQPLNTGCCTLSLYRTACHTLYKEPLPQNKNH